MATHSDPRLLDAAAARLVAATVRRDGVPAEVIPALATAADGWRGLVYADGGQPASQVALAESLSRLGHARAAVGQPEAADALSEGINCRRHAPPPAGERAPLALDLSVLGAVQMMTEPDAALPTLAEAVELQARLAEDEPRRWRGPLARGLLCLAALLTARGRRTEALTVTDDLLDVIGREGRVDIDRDALRRPLAALVDQLAPWHDDSPDAMVLRLRFSALMPRR